MTLPTCLKAHVEEDVGGGWSFALRRSVNTEIRLGKQVGKSPALQQAGLTPVLAFTGAWHLGKSLNLSELQFLLQQITASPRGGWESSVGPRMLPHGLVFGCK